jgi:mono/diheme cytochrome c family protein
MSSEKRTWKQKLRRAALVIVGALAVTAGGCVSYVQLTYKRDFSATPLPAIKAVSDPAVIERGAYVANAIAHCPACHGNGEFTRARKLPPDLKDLRGGYVLHAGPFGTFYPANITSDRATGVAALSDGELARVIRHGVAPNGRLDPLMSFAVGPMSDEDLVAVVSYVRSLPPVASEVPRDEWGFVAKALAGKFDPRMTTAPPYVPAGEASAARGEYLAKGPALCAGCHTPRDPMNGFGPTGDLFSGAGKADPDPTDPSYEIMAPNLTPDPETGILANYSEEAFLDRVKRGGRAVTASPMPWECFALMTDADLRSLYRFLHALPPTRRATGPTRRLKGWKPGS